MKRDLSIEAFVLAGGKSSRMGRDKGLMPLNKQPMVSRVLKVLQELALPVRIIANKPGYESLGFEVLKDEVQEKGPMGGLFTALQHSTADLILLVACDMPLISTEAVCMLMNAASTEHITVAAEGEKLNPLFALYPRGLKKKLKDHLDRGELKMADFISGNRHILVTSIGEKLPWALRNINNENDLKEVEEKWRDLL